MSKVQASHLTSQTQTWAKPKPLYKQKRARIRGENTSVLALFFFCRYIHFREICSRKMNSICFRYCSSSIYCRYAPIRYEINPSFAKQTYRVRQHISSLYISPLARYANHIENPVRDLSRCVSPLRITR